MKFYYIMPIRENLSKSNGQKSVDKYRVASFTIVIEKIVKIQDFTLMFLD